MPKDSSYQVHQIGRGRPRKTMKQRLVDLLNRKGDYVQLNELYNRLKADSIGDRAGIRGILNRNVGKDGIFIRGPKRSGMYKAA